MFVLALLYTSIHNTIYIPVAIVNVVNLKSNSVNYRYSQTDQRL